MKKALYVLAALLAVGALLFVCSDFARRTDVYAGTFELSEDGKTMTLHTGVMSSMGYTRALRTERVGTTLRCTFYAAFGGLNSRIGAQNFFDIPVEGCTEIAFFRGGGVWTPALQKDPATGEWIRCR